ncbi:hypothetical protein QR680_006034 [Steinernema hermaphroditum]|uniref:NR LBD domain-containing protein n=1 Tax=Steinernema hermaphroditum TaxID=289476 RepID=A0AA39HVF3_9BILA|nr:hypothetical protein QR680_006034 [Steinernema hermaphroditum]
METIHAVFSSKEHVITSSTDSSTLNRLKIAYSHFSNGKVTGQIHNISKMTLRQVVDLSGTMLTNAAKFAMSFEEFASLELDEKWQLYRNFAFYVNDIMTSVHTCNVLGYESRNKLICAGQYCYDPRELEVFDDSIAAEDLEKINNVYKSFFQIRYKAILPCFQLLQPSSTEICFLLAELLWSIEDNSSNNLKSAQGRFMERVLNEMHDYYAKELKIENYAKRLFKLYDYVFALRELGGTRRSACEVTDIFKHIHQPRTECFEYFMFVDKRKPMKKE